MRRDPGAPTAGVTRRGFLGMASAAVGLWIRPAWGDGARDGRRRAEGALSSSLARDHRPVLHLPETTGNGAKVPILVEMAHPMTPDHHITRIQVVNGTDPVPLKGDFHLTPGNGRVHLAFQARMHGGASEVSVTAVCNRHGEWSTTRTIEIPADAGGCAGTAPPEDGRTLPDDIQEPTIRIAELVERGRLRRGEIVHASVKLRHPSRTGLVLRDGRFVQESEPLHLEELEVHYGGQCVSRFALTAALADDPFITFCLLARVEGPLRVLLTNNRGRRFEATHDIRFS
jgi:sulfur-oxidizing protein SoxY